MAFPARKYTWKVLAGLDYPYALSGILRNNTEVIERGTNEKSMSLKCNVLNAKQHEKEAHIITQAGKPRMITIATNMAGRGTDIVLGGNYEAEIKALDNSSSAKIDSLKKDINMDPKIITRPRPNQSFFNKLLMKQLNS